MTGAGPMAEPPSPRTPHPVQTGGVHVSSRARRREEKTKGAGDDAEGASDPRRTRCPLGGVPPPLSLLLTNE